MSDKIPAYCNPNDGCPSLSYLKKNTSNLANRVDKIERKHEEILVTLTKINENLNNLIARIDESNCDMKDIEKKLEELSNRLDNFEKANAELVGTIKGVQWAVKIISSIIALASSIGILKFLSVVFR